MADWALPTLNSSYTNFLAELDGRLKDLVYGLDPAVTTLTSPLNNMTRWSSASNRWEKYNGSTWNPMASTYAIDVTSAGKWTTGRNLVISSDASGTSSAWDGSGNATLSLTLATVNSNVGQFGSATAIPIVTVNGKGLVTAVSTANIGTIATQAANNVSLTGGSISATNITLVQSTTAAPTAEGRVEWDTDNDTLMIGDGTGTKTFAPINASVTLTNHTLGTGCSWGGSAVPVANGGTGATDAATARSNLGLGSIATQVASNVSLTGGSISATNITLVQSTTAAPTAEGRIEWDTDNDALVIGTGAATALFAPVNAIATLTNHTLGANCTWSGNAVPVANGGTGSTTAAGARTNLGITYANIGTVPVANGGTGATDAATARSNLGITYANLGTVPVGNGGTGATTFTTGGFMTGNGASALNATAITGLVYGNGVSTPSAASAAQIVAAIGATAVTNATNASTAFASSYATYLLNGTAGNIPYQSAVNVTEFVPVGVSGQILRCNGAAAPSWANYNDLVTSSITGTKLRYSDLPEIQTTSLSNIELKNVYVPVPGTYSVSFDLGTTVSSGVIGQARLYVNGSAVGTIRQATGALVTFTEDVTLSSGQVSLQIFGFSHNAGNAARIANFKIKNGNSIISLPSTYEIGGR